MDDEAFECHWCDDYPLSGNEVTTVAEKPNEQIYTFHVECDPCRQARAEGFYDRYRGQHGSNCLGDDCPGCGAAENPADTVIEQGRIEAAAKVIRHWYVGASPTPMDLARALHDAGLLADPADRDWQMCDQDACEYTTMFKARAERAEAELEAWRSGRRRKSWPSIESVPDGLHYAAELVRAQGTEGGDAHDALLREAAARLKELNDIAPVLLADKERAEAEVDELQGRLSELLDNLTGGRMSKTNYDVRTMVQEVEAYFERTQDGEVAELRATVERVRELADGWAGERYDPSSVADRYIRGRDDQLTDCTLKLRAALDEMWSESIHCANKRPGHLPNECVWQCADGAGEQQ